MRHDDIVNVKEDDDAILTVTKGLVWDWLIASTFEYEAEVALSE